MRMRIENEIQNSNLKSKFKIKKVSLTRNQNQNMRLERLAPICVYMGGHIAGLGAGLGALGARALWIRRTAWPARPDACLGWQGKGAGIRAQRRAPFVWAPLWFGQVS